MSVDEGEVIGRLVRWADGEPLVRALILTSSRANPNASPDALSDYDVIVVTPDTDRFSTDDSWLHSYGGVLVCCRDSYHCCDESVQTCLVLYKDGVKIDFSLWSALFLDRVRHEPQLPDVLDVGYRVLVDKDRLTVDLKPPTSTAHTISPPTQAEFLTLVDEFWLETAYVAKNLRRRELIPAKYSLDAVIKFNLLRRMLEWYAAVDRDRPVKPGFMGRGLQKLLAPEVWGNLEATFVGPGIEENWQALFTTADLFRRTARTVGERSGYAYPDDRDKAMMAYLAGIKAQDREAQRSGR